MKKTIRMNERELHRLISESVKRVLNEHGYGNPARNSRIKQLQDTVQYVAEQLKNHHNFDEEGYKNNGTYWEGRIYTGYDNGFIDVCIRNYQRRVGTDNPETASNGYEGLGGVQVTGDIYDEYGTCLHNYVCACQGAPLGYMDRVLTPDKLVDRLISDINKCLVDDNE